MEFERLKSENEKLHREVIYLKRKNEMVASRGNCKMRNASNASDVRID
jgi:FtsZ-binding cell division protein ZapB